VYFYLDKKYAIDDMDKYGRYKDLTRSMQIVRKTQDDITHKIENN